MIRLALIAALSFATVTATPAFAAAPCKDAKGKFIKCPPPAPAAATARCKDAKGKFIKCPPVKPVATGPCKDSKGKFAKCGAPGATPVK